MNIVKIKPEIVKELERSIIEECPIQLLNNNDYFERSEDLARVSEVNKLMEKYTYGWYIAQLSTIEQIKSLDKFKEYIMDINQA